MAPSLTEVRGIGASAAEALAKHGLKTAEDLAAAPVATIAAVPGFSEARATTVKKAAAELVAGGGAVATKPRPAPKKKAAPRKKAATVKKAVGPTSAAEKAQEELKPADDKKGKRKDKRKDKKKKRKKKGKKKSKKK